MTDFARALHARYAMPTASPDPAAEWAAATPHPVVDGLLRHCSVRAFLPDPVPDATLLSLVAAAQSASTSSNLQTWSVVAVRDPERKARLAEVTGGQAHVRECPLLLMWIADLSRLDRVAEVTSVPADADRYLEMFLVSVVDAALAAQNAVVAAEAMGLGAVYIGAMRNRPEQVARELALPPRAFTVFGLCLGRPDPARPASVKPRLAPSAVLHHEQYRVDATQERAGFARYDSVMREFQASQRMPVADWTAQSSSRVRGPESLSGRDRLVAALAALGFPLD
jgi:nitroreductase